MHLSASFKAMLRCLVIVLTLSTLITPASSAAEIPDTTAEALRSLDWINQFNHAARIDDPLQRLAALDIDSGDSPWPAERSAAPRRQRSPQSPVGGFVAPSAPLNLPADPGAAQPQGAPADASRIAARIYAPLLAESGAAPISQLTRADSAARLTSRDGQVRVDLPAGSVAAPTAITLQRLPSQAIAGADSADRFFRLSAEGPGGNPLLRFQQPISITVGYGAAQPEQSLRLYRQTAGGDWTMLPALVDDRGNQVFATTDQAATFALLAPQDNPWEIGRIVYLCEGTEIRDEPSYVYPFHTESPAFWEVMVMDGPLLTEEGIWWFTSRKAAGDPSGGTGWVEQHEADCQTSGSNGEGGIDGFAPLSPYLRARYSRQIGLKRFQSYGLDPVSSGTGNFLLQEIDFSIPGVAGFDWLLERSYSSLDTGAGVFGAGWSSLLDMSLRLASDGSVDVRYADGGGAYFEPAGSGFEPGQENVLDTLTQEGESYLLTTPDQITYRFEIPGGPASRSRAVTETAVITGTYALLVEIKDRNNNPISIDRDGEGLIQTITDSAGRAYPVTYEEEQIVSIGDAAGRSIDYTYADGDLVGVTDANGGLRQYTYVNHRLVALTDPAGIEYLRNTYDDEGRVIDQIDANGAHSSATYAAGETTFTDQLGRATRYRYDDQFRLIETRDALQQSESYIYNDLDLVTTFKDKRGLSWTSDYDDRGNLTASTNPLGFTVSYTYDATNDRTGMTDQGGPGNAGRTTTYRYDERGNLTRIERPDTSAITLAYDGRGQMIKLTNPNGNANTFGYDGEGNMIEARDGLRHPTTFTYDAVGRLRSRTDANNHTTSFEYDGNDNLTRISDPRQSAATMRYDQNDNLIELTDRAGGVTSYEYDRSLNLTAETDPGGHRTSYAYDLVSNRVSMTDARRHTTEYRYDAIDRLVEVEDALHGVTRLEYDANDNLIKAIDALSHPTEYRYDEANQQRFMIDALGGVTEQRFDAVGRRTALVNPRGAVTEFDYDLLDRLVLVRDALGGEWAFAYDANGNSVGLTDANGHSRRLRYDAADRLVEQIDAGQHATAFSYDKTANVTARTDALGRKTLYAYDPNDNLISVTDALQGVTSIEYDREDRPTAVTDANRHTTRYAYDPDGLLIRLTEAGGQVSAFEYDATHNLTTFTNAKGNRWRSTYDELNRLSSETDPLGHRTGYRYDAVGQQTHRIDAKGIVTRSDYDGLGRLIAVVQNDRPDAAPDHETNAATRYAYDAAGNLTAIANANRETRSFAYDLLDRLTGEVDPLGRTWAYAYDGVGNLVKRTDAKGQITRYAYDADDLLTAISYQTEPGVTFSYDAVHNQTAMIDQLGTTTNQYDDLNRITASANHLGQRVGYGYDAVGNRTSLTYPDGRRVSYAYDPTNFAISVVDPDGNTFKVTRDATHNAVLVENPNQTRAEYDIDAAERLTAVRNLTAANPHTVISSFSYTLDPVGNRVQTRSTFRWRKPTNLNYDYAYDPLHRLVRSTDSEGHFTEYAYDAVGNRLRRTTNDDPTLVREIDTVTTDYSYDAADELIASVREVAPRGNADRADQTTQALSAFIHEIDAQSGKHIEAAAAADLRAPAAALIDAFGANPPSVDEAAAAIAGLRDSVRAAAETGAIDREGVANSLEAKLNHAAAANERRGGELLVTLYDYDLNGNRVRRTAPDEDTGNQRDRLRSDYAYDVENRLVHEQDFRSPDGSSWLPGDETMLTFDGYGRVFRRQHDQHIGGGGDQHWIDYVYDGLDPIAEYRNPSPQYANYYRGLGHILSQHDFKSQQSPQGTLYYYHYDGLDSVTGMTKHRGQSVHNYRYHDFGIILDINGHAADASNFTDPHNHYTLTGQEWDEYLELFHFYAREYDPETGTWLQQDPYRGRLAEPATLHRYAYVANSPVTYADAYGYDRVKANGVGCGKNMSCRFKGMTASNWLLDKLQNGVGSVWPEWLRMFDALPWGRADFKHYDLKNVNTLSLFDHRVDSSVPGNVYLGYYTARFSVSVAHTLTDWYKGPFNNILYQEVKYSIHNSLTTKVQKVGDLAENLENLFKGEPMTGDNPQDVVGYKAGELAGLNETSPVNLSLPKSFDAMWNIIIEK